MTIKDCAERLRSRDGFLILSHRRPDGDALGSAAGLCRGLRKLGKTAFILENPEATARYLPWVAGYHAPEGFVPGCLVSVDLADEGILQKNGGPYRGRFALSIDHHPSNSGYAAETLLMADRASCGEIIYLLLRELGAELDAETATLLYIAVTTDTGCFRYKNTDPQTLRIGADLLEAGASNDLNRRLFMKKRRSRLLLESAILEGLELFQSDEACIGTVLLADLARCGVTEEDMDDIASVTGQIEGVETSITLREQPDGSGWKVSVRTGEWANADAICREFGGGGHGMAAGGMIPGTLEHAKSVIREAVRRHWKQA